MRFSKKFFSYAITFFFLVIFLVYFILNIESFKIILGTSIWALVAIGLLKVIIFMLHGVLIKITVERFATALNIAEAIVVSVYSAIGNFFGPLLGGTGIRAVYLKKKHGLAYSKFISTLTSYYFILFLINSLFAIISLIAINISDNWSSFWLLLFFGAWLLGLLSLVVLKLPEKYRESSMKHQIFNKVIRLIYEAYDGWLLLKNHPNLMYRLGAVASGVFIVSLTASFIEFSVFDIEISLASLGLYTSLSVVSILFAITPGAIGIRETLLIFASDAMGITNEQVIQVAILDRAITYITLFVLGAITRSASKKLKLQDQEK